MGAGIQSPIPLIYLLQAITTNVANWDSATYPLDILGLRGGFIGHEMGFSHLSR